MCWNDKTLKGRKRTKKKKVFPLDVKYQDTVDIINGNNYILEGKLAVIGAVQEFRFKVLEVLFRQGANPAHLSVIPGDTPMHAALSIALERDKGL